MAPEGANRLPSARRPSATSTALLGRASRGLDLAVHQCMPDPHERQSQEPCISMPIYSISVSIRQAKSSKFPYVISSGKRRVFREDMRFRLTCDARCVPRFLRRRSSGDSYNIMVATAKHPSVGTGVKTCISVWGKYGFASGGAWSMDSVVPAGSQGTGTTRQSLMHRQLLRQSAVRPGFVCPLRPLRLGGRMPLPLPPWPNAARPVHLVFAEPR